MDLLTVVIIGFIALILIIGAIYAIIAGAPIIGFILLCFIVGAIVILFSKIEINIETIILLENFI